MSDKKPDAYDVDVHHVMVAVHWATWALVALIVAGALIVLAFAANIAGLATCTICK